MWTSNQDYEFPSFSCRARALPDETYHLRSNNYLFKLSLLFIIIIWILANKDHDETKEKCVTFNDKKMFAP